MENLNMFLHCRWFYFIDTPSKLISYFSERTILKRRSLLCLLALFGTSLALQAPIESVEEVQRHLFIWPSWPWRSTSDRLRLLASSNPDVFHMKSSRLSVSPQSGPSIPKQSVQVSTCLETYAGWFLEWTRYWPGSDYLRQMASTIHYIFFMSDNGLRVLATGSSIMGDDICCTH